MNSRFVQRIWRFFVSDSGFALLARAATVFVSVASMLAVLDKVDATLLPKGWRALGEYFLGCLALTLGLELALVRREIARGGFANAGSPDEEFVQGLLRYAKSLATSTPPRDDALLELRRWSSRTLHLLGRHEERAAIGQLALSSAAALRDSYTQASILIDDLGWALHQEGAHQEAKENVNEGLRLLTSSAASQSRKAEVLALQLKGRRHLVTINFAASGDISAARKAVKQLRTLSAGLPREEQPLHDAQLDHLEAAIICRHLDQQMGPSGVIDPTGDLSGLHEVGLERSAQAETSFAKIGDRERQVKALQVHVRLLRHCKGGTRIQAAESRLARIHASASRKLQP